MSARLPSESRVPSLRRRSFRRLAGAFAAIVFVLVASEVGLRALGYCTRVAVWYDPAIGFRAHPGQSRWLIAGENEVRVARATTNELGMRGPLPTRARTEGKLRVLTLGDSFTFGIGVGDDETYPAHLRRELPEAEIVDLSFPGWNVHNALCAYRVLGRSYRPDVVVFGFSMDDMAPSDPGVRYTSHPVLRAIGTTAIGAAIVRHVLTRIPDYRRQPPAEQAHLHAAWKEQPLIARRRPDLPRFAGLWQSAVKDLMELAHEVRADEARLLVVVFPREDQVRDERAGAARDTHFLLPQEYLAMCLDAIGVERLDLLADLVALPEEPFGRVARGHPSPAGYAAIAKAVGVALREE